jgi:hypothetical protein
MLLNETWRHGGSDHRAEDRDPDTDEVLTTIPLTDEGDLDGAFRTAAAAQSRWYEMLPRERDAEIMEERRDEIIDWLIHESGSTRIKANVQWQYARAVSLEASTFPTKVEGPIVPDILRQAKPRLPPTGRHGWYDQPVELSVSPEQPLDRSGDGCGQYRRDQTGVGQAGYRRHVAGKDLRGGGPSRADRQSTD